MLNRYETSFKTLKENGGRAFIPFNLLGYPDPNLCLEAARAMIAAGATALELGIAFSDPLADGPLIQQAASDVISSGFSVRQAFELLAQIRAIDESIPIGLLVYYNTVLSQGRERFFRLAKEAGADGVLIVDLPPESYSDVALIAKRFELASIFIISPLTTEQRLAEISLHASGFLYAVSRLGLTGVEESHDQQLESLLSKARALSKLPICVGFGVSSPVRALHLFRSGADGVITGSRIIEILKESDEKNCHELTTFLTEMITTAKFFAPASCCQ